MGKREKKTGKGRLDKYYKLAKEQGYRARSAFKLIQLDKKYDFLSNARCLIDLCAAPGGWLQVATKYMPPNSIIVGVDLVPIKPIPRVITFAEDITTEKCRKRLREEIKDWKADVVLHDGAPNVGTAWAQDAFTQSELVLSSMKLATEFLGQGGTFVTKVFRSKDYNSLLWVFNQLFTKVEATKPPSSRNVSAEIFVVCSGYKAPKRIDPKLLNPTHVFKDLDAIDSIKAISDNKENLNKDAGSTRMDKLTPAAFNVFHPEKKRRAREGYDEGDLTLFKKVPVRTFIESVDPIAVLGSVNQFDFKASAEDRILLDHESTSEDIKASCEDLKVLGKKDFKNLLKWRTTIREHLRLDGKKEAPSKLEDTVEVQPLTEEEQMALDIERLENEEAAKKRKERRRHNEKKARDVQRMQLQMTTPMDLGLERQDGVDEHEEDFMFDLNEMEGYGDKAKRVSLRDNEADYSEDEGSDDDESVTISEDPDFSGTEDEREERIRKLEDNLDQLYDEYQNHKLEKDARHKVKEARKKRDAQEGGSEWRGIKDRDNPGSDDEEGMSNSGEEDEVDDGHQDTLAYMDHDESHIPSDEVGSSDEEDIENKAPGNRKRTRDGNLIQEFKTVKKPLEPTAKSRAAAMWFDQPIFKDVAGLDDILAADAQPMKTSKASTDEQEFALAPKKKKSKHAQSDPALWDDEEDNVVTKEEENAQRIADYGLTTPEAMTLAQQLVNREKTAEQLIDDGFNRYAFNDKEGLPTWFLDDEMKHFRNNVPVTKEAVEAIREKMRALNARPIKKIAEAKARKKMRAIKRLAKVQKKADVINETGDLTEKEKSAQIARLINRATKEPKKKKDEVKVIVARGANRGLKGRPKGIKGRFKMVDPRGKKEQRALKRIAKRDGPKRRK